MARVDAVVDRSKALLELPTAYAVAVRLRDARLGDATIACALGIPAEAVPGLLRLADEKLKALLDE